MRLAPARAALLLFLAAGAGCAGVRPPPAPLLLPEETVEVRRGELELLGRNDEELFAIGQAAFQAGDHRRAADAFGRVADHFPASRHHPAALYDAGLSHLRLEEWRPALQRFLALSRGYAGPDADEAAFRAAACHHRLGELAEARALLERLAARADLPPVERVRAFTERGVVELEGGDPDGAERSLQRALSLWGQAEEAERFDDEAPAKAQYWLGEVQRRRFLALPLDFTGSEEAQGQALEQKSQLLLAAQSHYLRAARRGSPSFGIAGVARVGELYEALHAELSGAPLPAGLDEEEAAAWRDELWSQLSVLVQKAVQAYEGAISAARARGVEASYVQSAEAALERMKALLLDRQVPRAAAPAAPAARP